MTLKETILKATREVVTRTLGYPQNRAIDESRVQYFNADANDFVYRNIQNALNNGTGYAL